MSHLSRRQLLRQTACGFGSLALAGLAANEAKASPNPLAAKVPPIAPRAKRVIFLFMQGGPSQVDTFDYKPLLEKYDGQQFDFRNARKLANTGTSGKEQVMKSPWKFHQYGQSGQWVSQLFPHLSQHVDKCCFLHGLHTTGVAHGPATLFLHCGSINLVRPSVGSWINYGLGTENENLPGFVTIGPCSTNGGPRNYSAAFLPPTYQGTALGKVGQSARDFKFSHMAAPNGSLPRRERQFELLSSLNRLQARDEAAEGVIHSYELAWRMQMHAPGLLDLSQESPDTLAKYGIDQPATDEYGRQCLMARRLCEAGVRYIQVNYSDDGSNPRWDQHSRIQDHAKHALATDKPVAALLADLEERGLLEDTLVWWGGEFGRNPFTQGADGRDHNPGGFTHFLAGGGVKAGFAYGGTDEWGHLAIEGQMHMHDLHATLLHLLGIDHERLTYSYAGRDFRLTDVHGRVAHEIFA